MYVSRKFYQTSHTQKIFFFFFFLNLFWGKAKLHDGLRLSVYGMHGMEYEAAERHHAPTWTLLVVFGEKRHKKSALSPFSPIALSIFCAEILLSVV